MEFKMEESQRTQMSRGKGNEIKFGPCYKALYKNFGTDAIVLDYGAGRCQEATEARLRYPALFSYEPHPRDGILPDFVNEFKIPEGCFDVVLNQYVLNVLPPASRLEVVKNIAKRLRKGGTAMFAVRNKLPVKDGWKAYEDGWIINGKQFQAEITLEHFEVMFKEAGLTFIQSKQTSDNLVVIGEKA